MSLSNFRIKELERAEAKLNALESGGVDNWEYYGDSLVDYYQQISFEDSITDTVSELVSILFEGVFEPSEHGAGYATTDDALKNAEEYLLGEIQKIIASGGDK